MVVHHHYHQHLGSGGGGGGGLNLKGGITNPYGFAMGTAPAGSRLGIDAESWQRFTCWVFVQILLGLVFLIFLCFVIFAIVSIFNDGEPFETIFGSVAG